MEKKKYFMLVAGVSALSAVLGVALGYFVLGPVGVSARAGTLELSKENPEPIAAYASCALPAYKPESVCEPLPAYSYIVTSADGVIVVHYAGDKTGIKEVTLTPVNALPIEEQERLAAGIRIYSEEALIRILEDYGS